jgi:hypothetical protein
MSADGEVRKGASVSRLAAPMAAFFLVLLGTIIYVIHLRNIVPSGLPATLILGVGIYFVMKYVRVHPAAAVGQAKKAEQGAGPES